MIGLIVEFNTSKKVFKRHPNGQPYMGYEKSYGKVLDRITEITGTVLPGWAHSSGSNNVAVQESYTYYMIEDRAGIVHRVHTSDVLKVIDQVKA